MTRDIIIQNEQDMLRLGAQLARIVTPGMMVYLHGDLGAGKTTLCRGFLRALGHASSVKSPTYTLVESYQLAGKEIYHFDLYRLRDPKELYFMGIDDYFTEGAINLIEWPEKGRGCLPEADLSCYIELADTARHMTLVAHKIAGRRVLAKIIT